MSREASKRPRAIHAKPVTTTAALVSVAADEVDEDLVQEAVAWIRDKVSETVSRGLTEIGDYVFDRFFGGDVARLSARGPNKNASFASLVERCESTELPLSRSALHRAVATAAMRRALPEKEAAFKQLPPSHQALLLPLRDPAKVERIAQRALAKKLSVRALKEVVNGEVEKVAPEPSGRGRPPKPLVLKVLDRSHKVFSPEGGKRTFTKAEVDELSNEQAADALKSAQALRTSLDKLIERLEARG